MAEIISINGPIVTARMHRIRNGELVRLGDLGLVGEVISIAGDQAVVQAYESTESLRPGESVTALGHALSVDLGPGLIGQIFDGVQRSLKGMQAASGDHLARGLDVPALDPDRPWHFVPATEPETRAPVRGGQILGSVQETPAVLHRILVPPDISGVLLDRVPEGDYTLGQTIARVEDPQGRVHKLPMLQRWPVRTPRPYRGRDHEAVPLITGQRILDTFFPLLKGGKAAVPGPFGAGKTMVQQQIARWSNADIVIYVGCGERGNEMVDILKSFPELTDPHTGRSLMERTLLIANTSNMPVVAREASIYVGVTIAEYFRDQGRDVVMVADSTSRWAEALREVGGRLGQMPVEEGYPAYLASRLAAFYERAGRVRTLSGALGSVTLIGAVSPPGGDFSEPVTSHTKEIVRTFWALNKELADARHYPSVGWNESFSGYVETAATWWHENVSPDWQRHRHEALALLTEADDLARIVNLVGPEALSPEQRWVLEGARLIREGLLQQSALDEMDSYASPQKQAALLKLMLDIFHQGQSLLPLGVPVAHLARLPELARAVRIKTSYDSTEVADLERFAEQVRAAFDRIRMDYSQAAEARA